jgi:hypothetical protein
MMKTLWRNLTYSVRMLVKSPRFMLVAIIAIARGRMKPNLPGFHSVGVVCL